VHALRYVFYSTFEITRRRATQPAQGCDCIQGVVSTAQVALPCLVEAAVVQYGNSVSGRGKL
jgi:hypothetical protein